MENNETIPTPNATPAANPASTPPSAAPSGTATPPPPAGGVKPALYNPNVASSLSVFFTPIFGGWCCRHNYRALGLPDKAKRSQMWMILGVVYLLLSLFVPGVGKGWLFFLVVWYYCDGRKQAKYLKDNNVAYEKKGWLKPVLVAAGALVLLVSVLAISSKDKQMPHDGSVPTTASTDAWKEAPKTPSDERVYETDIYGCYVCGNRIGLSLTFSSGRKRSTDFVVFDLEEFRKVVDKAIEWNETLEKNKVSETVKKKIRDISMGVGQSQLADEQANLRAKFAYAEGHATNVSLEFVRYMSSFMGSTPTAKIHIVIVFGEWSGDFQVTKGLREAISPESIAQTIKSDKAKRAKTEDLLK